MAESGPPSTTEQPAPLTQGASVSVQYATRTMRMYAINESEVTTISSFNSQATAYFSISSFLIASAIGIFTNGAFSNDLTSTAKLAEYYIAPILMLLGIVSAGLAVMAMRGRDKLWDGIRNESG